MYIDERKFYQIVYSMRSTLSDICGIAERLYMSEHKGEKEFYLDEIRKSVNGFTEFQTTEYEDEKFVGDVSNLHMKDTKALIIDENEISNNMMENVLRHFDVNAEVAKNGYEGIELFRNNSYDIVFLGYVMPDMNGVEIAKKIRSMEKGRDQLVIGLTSSIEPEFKEGLNSSGIELILPKPVRQEHIGFILSKELPHKTLQVDFNKV